MQSSDKSSSTGRQVLAHALNSLLVATVMYVLLQPQQQSYTISRPAPTKIPPQVPAAEQRTRTTTTTTVTIAKATSPLRTPVSLVEEFSSLARACPCTDKTTTHRYQYIYGFILPHLKALAASQSLLPPSERRPIRMLEMGAGCDMGCPMGGYKLFRAIAPEVEYHVLEYQMHRCRLRDRSADLSIQDIAFINAHLCEGDSSNHSDLAACGAKFGPFDLIIDDASHMQPHIRSAFDFWLPSKYLSPGGFYLVEDLQTSFIPGYGSTVEDKAAFRPFAHFAAQIALAKMAFAHPHEGAFDENRADIHVPALAAANLVDNIIVSAESVVFHKYDKK